MWTGNLSYWLVKPHPPGPQAQQLNAWLHKPPVDVIAHGIYWCVVLMFGAPFLGMAALWISIFQATVWCIQTYYTYFSWGRTVLGQAQAISESSGEPVELAIVVTGCDTGFGKDLALQLAEKGFVVFVGCLQENSTKLFGQSDKLRPILLDVTKDDRVTAAAKSVTEWLSSSSTTSKRYLHAIVNNAGIGKIGYLDWLNLSDFEQCMNVNCWGHVRMTKAFLPIFKQQAAAQINQNTKMSFYAPQIMNMISMAGTCHGGLSAMPYEVSKTAALAFSDGLRLEMKPWGVHVVDVNPSFHTTPLATNIFEGLQHDIWEPLPDQLKEEYGKDFFENYGRHVERLTSQQWDPSITVEAMVRALLSRDPPCRINVGMDAKFSLLLYSMYPTWLRTMCMQLLLPDQTPAMLRKQPSDSKKED
ncbi:short-chain dehydrogenase/reductase family protein [Nitzschia inconspicua]|uniref:Short-chain dehydrogenase/reductase family protein n=1 Tax=Nitzschia inconspicua TaxID=303405 RepID=A0A9K3L1U1_9STRA|nr:short-chain dehydrogenase/reductase family protein [Nitzschia inconspicua]